jgi:hypothetical protein
MRLHVEQAQFENSKQAARARANDQHIGFDSFAHIASFRLNPAGRPGLLLAVPFGCACLANTEGRGKP